MKKGDLLETLETTETMESYKTIKDTFQNCTM